MPASRSAWSSPSKGVCSARSAIAFRASWATASSVRGRAGVRARAFASRFATTSAPDAPDARSAAGPEPPPSESAPKRAMSSNSSSVTWGAGSASSLRRSTELGSLSAESWATASGKFAFINF